MKKGIESAGKQIVMYVRSQFCNGTIICNVAIHAMRILVAFFFMNGNLFGQISGGIRSNVEYSRPLKLQPYGGPDVDLVILEKNLDMVRFVIVDHEHPIATVGGNSEAVSGGVYYQGTPRVVFQPRKQNKSIKLEGGIEVSDLHRQAYLLYEHDSGIKVYYLDVLDVRQSECALLIVLLKNRSGLQAIPADERLRQIETLLESGLISAEEAQKKRKEILAGL